MNRVKFITHYFDSCLNRCAKFGGEYAALFPHQRQKKTEGLNSPPPPVMRVFAILFTGRWAISLKPRSIFSMKNIALPIPRCIWINTHGCLTQTDASHQLNLSSLDKHFCAGVLRSGGVVGCGRVWNASCAWIQHPYLPLHITTFFLLQQSMPS